MANIEIPTMLEKLDSFYKKEEEIKKDLKILCTQLEQLYDDIELLEFMIMFKSNKNYRDGNYK